jgi:hypothetical protein
MWSASARFLKLIVKAHKELTSVQENRLRSILLVLLATLLQPALSPAVEPAGNEARSSRDVLLKAPGIVRYYAFDRAKDPAVPVESLVGPGAPLHYSVAGQGGPQAIPRRVPGRLAGSQAVRLDRGIYSAPVFPIDDKSFTVEAWVRTHGQGAIKGDTPQQSGTLLSQGNGYVDGWRIILSYPARTLRLELGRPPHAFDIGASLPMLDGVWHHLAATWDGRQAAIYLDGLVAASGAYDGDYVPPAAGAVFRLGYADAGWGSILADYDEVAVYRRALSPREIAAHALLPAPLSPAAAARLEAADRAVAAGDPAGAADHYRALLQDAAMDPRWQAVVRLRLAQVFRQQGSFSAAMEQYCAVARMPDLSENLTALAVAPVMSAASDCGGVPREMLDFLLRRPENSSPVQQIHLRLSQARALAAQGETAKAVKVYEELLAGSSLSPHDRWEALLQLGHAQAAAGQLAAARQAYARVWSQSGAPASFRSHALLCASRTCLAEKEFAAAEKLLQQVVALADVPDVYRWEALETLGETRRLARGLPARNPEESRTKVAEPPRPAIELYVAPAGADSNPGSRQKPLATLARAQAVVRGLIQKGLPAGGVVVQLSAGEYRLRETLSFGSSDGGSAQSPVVWRAEQPGRAVLSGGGVLRGWRPVTDPAILARLPAEARGKVFESGLAAQGIRDISPLKPRGFGRGSPRVAVLELFWDGQPLVPARWPGEGFARVSRVLSNDDQGAVFEYAGDRPDRWRRARDAWLFGYWKWQWADSQDPLLALDAGRHSIRLPKVAYGGIERGAAYFVYNLLEEIDRPGRWCLDRGAGKLYLYPPGDPATADVRLSLLASPLILVRDASWLRLEGLTLELGQTTGIQVQGGEHCLIAGCTIRNLGGDAVVVDGGRGHGLLSCDLYNLGRGGCVVAGGDRRTLEASGHYVENCEVHHYSRIDRCYTPAVWLEGCGTRVAHNRFRHSPCQALRIEGNDHLVELNEVFEVAREMDDNGGVDMFLNPSYRGVVLRYNSWHDIGAPYATPIGQAAIRLDDAISGVLIYGNLFRACSTTLFGAVQLHGGKDDAVVNNVFTDCKYAISFSLWGPQRWKQFLQRAELQKMLHQTVDIDRPPYSTRYPALARLAESEGVHQIWSNVARNCGEFLTRDRGLQDLMDNQTTLAAPPAAAAWPDPELTGAGQPDGGRLRMPGFRPIPSGEIGLYEDGYRGAKRLAKP